MSVILFVTVCQCWRVWNLWIDLLTWQSEHTETKLTNRLHHGLRQRTYRPSCGPSCRPAPAAVVLHFSITPSELLAFRPALFSSSLFISSLPMIAWNIGTFWDVPVLDVTPKKHPEITLFTYEIEVIKESCVCWAPPVRTVQNNSFLQSKLKLNWTVCWKPGLYSHFHIMLASQLDSQWAPRTWTL